MDKALYLSMTGAKSSLAAQATNANNLANASTSGFRADIERFSSLPVYGPGHPSRVYAQDEAVGYNSEVGSLMQTGRAMDLGIAGEGWFAVSSADGGEAYTRRGDLRVDSGGLLLNGAGQPIIGNSGPITLPPFEEMILGRDGTVTIQPIGAAEGELALIDQIKLVKSDNAEMKKGKDGLFRAADGQDLAADGTVQVNEGSLESSNVNGIESMVNMIEYSRNFESMVKFFDELEKMDSASTRLMSVSS